MSRCAAAPLLAQREHRADVLGRQVDRGEDHRLLDALDLARGRAVAAGRLDLVRLAVARHDAVAHGRRGRDQVEVVLALEPLLDDLASAGSRGSRSGSRSRARRSSRARSASDESLSCSFSSASLQVLVVVGVDGVEAREHHRLHVRGSRAAARARGRARVGERVADAHLGERLDARPTTMPTSPAASCSTRRGCGSSTCSVWISCSTPLAIMRMRWPRREPAVDDAHEHHRAHVRVEPGVEDQRARRRVGDRPSAAAPPRRSARAARAIALARPSPRPAARPRRRGRSRPRSPARRGRGRPTGRSILFTTGMISRPASTAR